MLSPLVAAIAEWTRNEIRACKELTDKPFGVNLMLMAPNKDELVNVIIEEKPAFVTLGAGNPVPYIKPLQEAGIKVIPVVPSLKLAKRIEEAGADAMIVEGMEAGGHIGSQTTMSLMENILPEISIPVVVAGSIVDGRGLAAALLMGARRGTNGLSLLASRGMSSTSKYERSNYQSNRY